MSNRAKVYLILAFGLLIGLSNPSFSQQAQSLPKNKARPAAIKPKETKRAAAEAVISPQDPNGRWEGTTSQDKEIVLIVHKGSIALAKIAYTIPGKGCFSVPELNNTFQVDYFGAKAPPAIKGGRIEVIRNQTSGGVNAAPMMFLHGRFNSPGSIRGDLELIAMSAPGNPPCQASVKMTFTAKRNLGAGQTPSSAVVGPNPANPFDGNWFGITAEGKRFRFIVKNNLVDNVDMTWMIPDGTCEGYARDQWGNFSHEGTVWDIQQSYNEKLRQELASKAAIENASFRAEFGKRNKAVFTGRFASSSEGSGDFEVARAWQERELPPCKLEVHGTWEAIRP